MKSCWLTGTLVAFALASPASAQSTGTDEHAGSGLKRIEVGIGLSKLYVGDFGGGNGLAGLQARVNLSRRFAVETTGNIYLGGFIHGFDYTGPRGGWDQPSHVSIPLYGIYGVQVHQSFEPHGRVTPFVTYGGTGWFEYERVNEFRVPSGTGDTIMYPAASRRTVIPPLIPTAGGGVRVKLARAVVLEAGVQTYFLLPYVSGVAAQVGIMVPIGWRRSP